MHLVVTGTRLSKDCVARNRHNNLSHLMRKWRQSKSISTVQNVSLRMHMMYSELVKSKDWNRRTDGTKKPSRT